MLTSQSKGVYAIAPTPFLPDGTLDEASISRMAEFYIAKGVDGLTVLGLLGEANKLVPEEAVSVVKASIDGFKGRPVIVGVSSPGLQSMRRLAREAMDLGAAGVMFTPPSGMRTDEQIATYVRQAVEAIGADVPFVLQDHPTVTGVVMSSQLIRRIVQETPSCVMLKHEDWPGLEKISLLRRWQSVGEMRDLAILCGNGGLFLDCEMARGADGAMTGYAFPEMLVDVVAHHSVGNRQAAQDIFEAHLPLLRYEQQPAVGLAVRKYILQKRGAIAHGTLRAPGSSLGSEAIAEIDFLLERLSGHDRSAVI
ncbi:dihydrodipicolinate synthase family protein [Mesorhizobium sp. ES1-4]|uniref:dihydrodipicolinate synthase family protein n=1 Tax=Mesorhizobium sp. ES1-4 TaxID=2876627 RepID=UPI001CCD0A85|nr:dihydrodipicolinate synthase family protein [Mesorhizobium sp. ES1-4]MBZ9798448.1 dihydrodipicolinate synthase family protein [Mesorhizobium sp. ES1-4]